MQDLPIRFEQASLHYAVLKDSCEQQVVAWQWASGQIHEPHPFYFLRHRWQRGRRLRSRPKRNISPYQYGFDASNRIMLIRTFLGASERCYEEFFTYHDHMIEGTYYSYDSKKIPINVTRQITDNRKILSFELFAKRGQSIEKYAYHNNLISIISVQGTAQNTGSFTQEYQFLYDQHGKLQTIAHTYEGMKSEII